jgi:GNAT superfamily N-acetyltransferase
MTRWPTGRATDETGPVTPTAEIVDAARTRELRRSVLRPNLPPDAPLPGDDLPAAVHFGVVEGGEVLSTCFVFLEPCPWRPDLLPSWHLRQMATAPPARGRGLGGAVLDAALAHAATAGGRVLWCNVREAAIGFYRRHGLRGHGAIFTDEQHAIPHLRMWRELGT